MRGELRQAMARAMSEDQLVQAIREAAGLMGWRQVHLGGDQRGIYQGDRGLPDLVLARRGRVLFLECKSMTGQPTVDQLAWLQAIDPDGRPWTIVQAPLWPVLAFLVRPTDLDAVLEMLK